MAFMTKQGQGYTNRPAAMRADRMADSKPPAAKPQAAHHKSVTIHHDGSKFHVIGDGAPSTEHNDIHSALEHARSIFGSTGTGNEDAAEMAGGEHSAL